MNEEASALAVEHLTKSYGDVKAVDDISFTVGHGDFFGFLGSNGAGKTTTINCSTGIARITSGAIQVFGHDVVRDYRQARARVGLSPQEYDVDIFATPRDTLHYVAGFYGFYGNERRQRVEETLERFGLLEHAEKEFRFLSGGLKRRMMIARALVHSPPLLILDEPTAGIDVELRQQLWRHFREINKAGTTILLTSHYIEEVEMLCDRVAVIHEGKIVALDTTEALTKGGETSLEKRYLELTGTPEEFVKTYQ